MGFFDDLSFGSVLPIVGNMIDAGIGHYESNRQMHYQTDSMREQMAWQEKMNEQQQEWQESMWNKTNEYNTPSAQLGRMVAAGINPNNAAMQVAGGSNNAQMGQQPQTPSAPSGLAGSKPSPTNFGQGFEEAALLDSQIKLNNAKAKEIDANADVARKQAEWYPKVQQQNIEESQKRVNHLDQQIENLKSQKDLTDEQKKQLELLNKEKQFEVEVMQPLQKKMAEKQYDIACQEYVIAKKQCQVMDAQIAEAYSRIAKNRQEIEILKKQGVGIDIDNQIKAIEKRIKQDEQSITFNKKRQEGIKTQFWKRIGAPDNVNLSLYTAGQLATQFDKAENFFQRDAGIVDFQVGDEYGRPRSINPNADMTNRNFYVGNGDSWVNPH